MSISKFILTVFVAMFIAVPTDAFYYKIDEGYRGLVSYRGKYDEKLLMPGEAGFSRPNIWPTYVGVCTGYCTIIVLHTMLQGCR